MHEPRDPPLEVVLLFVLVIQKMTERKNSVDVVIEESRFTTLTINIQFTVY